MGLRVVGDRGFGDRFRLRVVGLRGFRHRFRVGLRH